MKQWIVVLMDRTEEGQEPPTICQSPEGLKTFTTKEAAKDCLDDLQSSFPHASYELWKVKVRNV